MSTISPNSTTDTSPVPLDLTSIQNALGADLLGAFCGLVWVSFLCFMANEMLIVS